jgi:hypothetical protein
MRCGTCARAEEIGRVGITLHGTPLQWRLISHTKGRAQISENTQFPKVFHFCEAPSVTVGFIGFLFDIS